MTEPAPFDLRSRGWLSRFLSAYLDGYDIARTRDAVREVLERYPGAPLELQSHRLALRRLEGVGLRPIQLAIPAALRERLGLENFSKDDLETIGLLVTRLDMLQDIAWLHREQREATRSKLEILAVIALGLKEYGLARKLHAADERERLGEVVPVEKLAAKVEARLAKRDQLQQRNQTALSIGLGIAYIEARVLARIASLYYERAAIEEEGVERLHAMSSSEKVELVEVLLHLAWADGVVTPEERTLIERQVQLAELKKSTSGRLLRQLDTPPQGDPLADLVPLEDASTRRFILEQAILLSLVDDDQDESEVDALHEISRRLGGEPDELETIMVEVSGWYERNREIIRDFGPVAGSLGRLRRLVVDRATDAVRSNMRKIVQEIKETGELAKLLGMASVRQLTPEESAKVKNQLLDVCKTVPALALFLLPGGGLLLPVLIKLLPFNILPTAFGDETAVVDRVAPPDPER